MSLPVSGEIVVKSIVTPSCDSVQAFRACRWRSVALRRHCRRRLARTRSGSRDRFAIDDATSVGGPDRRLTAARRRQRRERRAGEVVNPDGLRRPLNADRHGTAVRRDRRVRVSARRRGEGSTFPPRARPTPAADRRTGRRTGCRRASQCRRRCIARPRPLARWLDRQA